MSNPHPNLFRLRKRIDRLDNQIIRLLNQRMQHAEKIGGIKASNGAKVYDPRRERELMKRLTAKLKGPLTATQFQTIYRKVLHVSRQHQRKVFQQIKARK
jgi:chorismate mutase-like protein